MDMTRLNADASEGSMEPLKMVASARVEHWVIASAVILLIDYLTGPFIQFPILFVVPVAVATAAHGLIAGVGVALLLPLIRLSFFLKWELQTSWALEWVDTLVDMAILSGFAATIHQLVRQQRQIKVLEGMLPICGFCKRIRDQNGEWRALEGFITERSSASFSHTFCEQCGKIHYPGLVD
jgi:hypothetical protein